MVTTEEEGQRMLENLHRSGFNIQEVACPFEVNGDVAMISHCKGQRLPLLGARCQVRGQFPKSSRGQGRTAPIADRPVEGHPRHTNAGIRLVAPQPAPEIPMGRSNRTGLGHNRFPFTGRSEFSRRGSTALA